MLPRQINLFYYINQSQRGKQYWCKNWDYTEITGVTKSLFLQILTFFAICPSVKYGARFKVLSPNHCLKETLMKAFFNRFAFAFAAIATLLFAAPTFSQHKTAAELAHRDPKSGPEQPKDNGGLFTSHDRYKGVFPADIHFKTGDSVGDSCNEKGMPDSKAKYRCRHYVDSSRTEYLIRLSPEKDYTFFYRKAGDRVILTPYTMYDHSERKMYFASDEGRQFASARGLSIGGTQLAKAPAATPASTAPVQVAAANCANMQNRSARTACEKTTKQGDQTSPIATFGGMVEAFGRKIKP